MEINWWSQHYQTVWVERAADQIYPLWQRIGFLAMGTHRANGHANFRPGELAKILGQQPGTNFYREIRHAKDRGWIDQESGTRCLIVPAHAVKGGQGHPNEVCAVHTGKRTGRPNQLTAMEYNPVISLEVARG